MELNMAGDGCYVWTVLAKTWELPCWATLPRCLFSISMGTDGLLLIRAVIKLGNCWAQLSHSYCKAGLTAGWGHHMAAWLQMEGIKIHFLVPPLRQRCPSVKGRVTLAQTWLDLWQPWDWMQRNALGFVLPKEQQFWTVELKKCFRFFADLEGCLVWSSESSKFHFVT